jgi:hypothetical protein
LRQRDGKTIMRVTNPEMRKIERKNTRNVL